MTNVVAAVVVVVVVAAAADSQRSDGEHTPLKLLISVSQMSGKKIYGEC